MIEIKTDKEIEIMRRGGQILARVLRELAQEVKPGVSLKYLDDLAEKLILGYDAKPSFKGYRPAGSKKAYPTSLCVSLNHEIVHGVPDSRILKEGDVISLDLGVYYQNYHTDSALTLGVGSINHEAQHLINVTKEVLDLAIAQIKPGIYWGDVASLMQKYVEEAKLTVVTELTGHGVGHNLQEDPFLPNYGQAGDGPLLIEGMVIAVEPMVVTGRAQVEVGVDGFVYQTKDKGLAAHFEHTLAITAEGVSVLTQL